MGILAERKQRSGDGTTGIKIPMTRSHCYQRHSICDAHRLLGIRPSSKKAKSMGILNRPLHWLLRRPFEPLV